MDQTTINKYLDDEKILYVEELECIIKSFRDPSVNPSEFPHSKEYREVFQACKQKNPFKTKIEDNAPLSVCIRNAQTVFLVDSVLNENYIQPEKTRLFHRIRFKNFLTTDLARCYRAHTENPKNGF